MIKKILTAIHLIRSPLLFNTISLSLILEAEGLEVPFMEIVTGNRF